MMFRLCLILILLVSSGGGAGELRAAEDRSSPAECPDADPPSIYPFALYLYGEGRWDQAATEFQRFCFFCPEDERVPEALLFVGACYEKMERFPEAVEVYRRLRSEDPGGEAGNDAWFRLGESLYRQGKFEACRIELQSFLDRDPPVPWRERTLYRMAWASLRLHAFAPAREQFSRLASGQGPWREPSGEVAAALSGIRDLPYRSPVLAGVLSALLPGAGQLYAGETKDALLSFLVNGALIAGTYEAFDKEVYGVGGVGGVVTLSFYAGNVYGAVNSAHHANRDSLTGVLNPLAKEYEWIEAAQGPRAEAFSTPARVARFPAFPPAGRESPERVPRPPVHAVRR